MSTLSVRLPSSLHRHLKSLASREGVSMNQLISSAVGEKVASLLTEEYLAERAARGNRRAFDAALAKVPDVEPTGEKALPNNALKLTSARSRPARRHSVPPRRRPQ
jgi:hypothetical protein